MIAEIIERVSDVTIAPEKAERSELILTCIPCPNIHCQRGWIEADFDWYPCPTCDRAGEIEVEVCSACSLRENDCKC